MMVSGVFSFHPQSYQKIRPCLSRAFFSVLSSPWPLVGWPRSLRYIGIGQNSGSGDADSPLIHRPDRHWTAVLYHLSRLLIGLVVAEPRFGGDK